MLCPTRFCSCSFVIPNLCFHNSSDKISFYLFADDTNLLSADKNLKCHDGQWQTGESLGLLNTNKGTLNAKKSNFVIFCPYQCKMDHSVNTQMFDSSDLFFTSLE